MIVQSRAYPHEHLVEEDEMGQSVRQSVCLDILASVLRGLLAAEGCLIARDLTCYHAAVQNSKNLISPDLAVFLGVRVDPDEDISSWDMRSGRRSAPRVVFEVSSRSTWRSDIVAENKPALYGAMGVREYIACDPNEPSVWPGRGGVRVMGWRYGADGQGSALVADARGWIWSAELGCFVGYEGRDVRLYDAGGVRLPTQEEAEQQRADEERAARLAEQQRNEVLRRLLRERGIDPDLLP